MNKLLKICFLALATLVWVEPSYSIDIPPGEDPVTITPEEEDRIDYCANLYFNAQEAQQAWQNCIDCNGAGDPSCIGLLHSWMRSYSFYHQQCGPDNFDIMS